MLRVKSGGQGHFTQYRRTTRPQHPLLRFGGSALPSFFPVTVRHHQCILSRPSAACAADIFCGDSRGERACKWRLGWCVVPWASRPHLHSRNEFDSMGRRVIDRDWLGIHHDTSPLTLPTQSNQNRDNRNDRGRRKLARCQPSLVEFRSAICSSSSQQPCSSWTGFTVLSPT